MLLVCAGVAVAIARGADSSSGKSENLESAKRDYEALQSATSRLPGQKLAPAKEGLPVLDAAPPSSQPLIPKRTPRKQDGSKADQRGTGKSSNWLVEAMREEAAAKTPEDEALRASETKLEDEVEKGDLVETALALERQEVVARKQREERRNEIEKRRSSPSANPLNNFMASWMTPGDFELLAQPKDGANSEASVGSSLGLITETSAATSPSMTLFSSEGRQRNASSLLPAERENPYLAPLLELPLPPASAANASEITPAISDFSAPLPTRAPLSESVSAPPSRIPLSETLRGNDDAKYFKQLKRF